MELRNLIKKMSEFNNRKHSARLIKKVVNTKNISSMKKDENFIQDEENPNVFYPIKDIFMNENSNPFRRGKKVV